MKRIMKLTEKQLEDFNNPNKRLDIMRDVLGIKINDRVINTGDTMVLARNSKRLDVFKDNFNGKDYYYIIMKVVDDECAYAISVY